MIRFTDLRETERRPAVKQEAPAFSPLRRLTVKSAGDTYRGHHLYQRSAMLLRSSRYEPESANSLTRQTSLSRGRETCSGDPTILTHPATKVKPYAVNPIRRFRASGGITQSSTPSSSGVSNPPPCSAPASTTNSS